ncbi:MAG: hypothetical protein IJZ56_05250 [Oscillospiraceae bacterium]|nr:hypothetical protein [Oscillospiraceae bacterium]
MGNNEYSSGFEIDIWHMFKVILSRLWMILLVGAIGGALSVGYARLMVTPTYASSIQLYVNNQYPDSPGFSSSQITAGRELVDTYMVILESRNVLEDVLEMTELDYTYNQLKSMVSATAVNETEVFTVTVTGTDPEDAHQLANALADILPDKIAAVVDGSSVRVVDYAVKNGNPVAPSYSRYAMLGVLAGLFMSLLVVVVNDILDTRIHSEEHLATVYKDVPLLAVIPPAASTGKSGYDRGSYAAHTPTNGGKQGGEK